MSSGVLTEPNTPDGAQAFRLSFSQERIWFTEQLNPGRAGLTISTALHVHGELDAAAFRGALAALVRRHEALRTRFVARRSGPVQEVLAHAEVPFDVVDLPGQPAPDELSGLLGRYLDTTFELTAAPLLRARLLRLGGGYSVLLLAIHHIICDGLSADILLRDLTELYRAARSGAPANLPELGLQYPDFAEWQRETIDERVIAAQLDYWEQELAGTTGLVDLPTDHPRASTGDVGGALVSRLLPGTLCARVVEVARQAQASPFMLLLAAYQVVLARTSGRGDFCVGTSIGARSQHELSGVLGCFINLLALRSDTTGDLTLRELLAAVRSRCLRAYGQADVPFERVVERLAPGRSGQGRTPLFEVLLAVQDGRTGSFEVDGVTLTPELVAVPAAQYDLALDVQIDAGGASLVLCYATGIFTAATAERFLDRVEHVLAAFAADPDQRISAVDLGAGGDTDARVLDFTGTPALPGAVGELVGTGDLARAGAPGEPPEVVGRVGDTPATAGQVGVDAPRPEPVPPRTELERAILDCFAYSLDRADLGIHDDFFGMGGTSLAAARLVGALGEATGTTVPLRLLFQHTSVAALARALVDAEPPGGGGTALRLAARDAILPAGIHPAGEARTGPVRQVLVTGATGFIGAHLVRDLVDTGVERVACLVRAGDGAAAQQRLRDTFDRYQLDWDPRITAIPGDLADEQLGLSDVEFAELAAATDVIYHSGGEMNFVLPYRSLRDANVRGTLEVIRLACQDRPSALHYVSTIDAQLGDRLAEEPVALDAGATDGYVLTKKVAEHLVLAAGERGLPVGVYRPWLVTANSRTGAANESDQLALSLAGCLLARVIPADLPAPLRLLPVDMLTAAIVELSTGTDPAAPIHQFHNPAVVPLREAYRHLGELGYELREVPFDRWRVEVARRTAGRLDGLSALLAVDTPTGAADALAGPQQVETANTARRLGRPLAYPALDAGYVHRMVGHLAARGVVPAAINSDEVA